MLSSKDITQSLLIAVAIILLITILLSLVGCLVVTDAKTSSLRTVKIDADCEEDQVKVNLSIEKEDSDKGAEVAK